MYAQCHPGVSFCEPAAGCTRCNRRSIEIVNMLHVTVQARRHINVSPSHALIGPEAQKHPLKEAIYNNRANYNGMESLLHV